MSSAREESSNKPCGRCQRPISLATLRRTASRRCGSPRHPVHEQHAARTRSERLNQRRHFSSSERATFSTMQLVDSLSRHSTRVAPRTRPIIQALIIGSRRARTSQRCTTGCKERNTRRAHSCKAPTRPSLSLPPLDGRASDAVVVFPYLRAILPHPQASSPGGAGRNSVSRPPVTEIRRILINDTMTATETEDD